MCQRTDPRSKIAHSFIHSIDERERNENARRSRQVNDEEENKNPDLQAISLRLRFIFGFVSFVTQINGLRIRSKANWRKREMGRLLTQSLCFFSFRFKFLFFRFFSASSFYLLARLGNSFILLTVCRRASLERVRWQCLDDENNNRKPNNEKESSDAFDTRFSVTLMPLLTSKCVVLIKMTVCVENGTIGEGSKIH